MSVKNKYKVLCDTFIGGKFYKKGQIAFFDEIQKNVNLQVLKETASSIEEDKKKVSKK